jgi:hypothetical protein
VILDSLTYVAGNQAVRFFRQRKKPMIAKPEPNSGKVVGKGTVLELLIY